MLVQLSLLHFTGGNFRVVNLHLMQSKWQFSSLHFPSSLPNTAMSFQFFPPVQSDEKIIMNFKICYMGANLKVTYKDIVPNQTEHVNFLKTVVKFYQLLLKWPVSLRSLSVWGKQLSIPGGGSRTQFFVFWGFFFKKRE